MPPQPPSSSRKPPILWRQIYIALAALCGLAVASLPWLSPTHRPHAPPNRSQPTSSQASASALPVTRPTPQLLSRTTMVTNQSIQAMAVKEAFLHAWIGYKKYAWGMDELRPNSKTFSNWGATGMGLSIVESMGTLWIMGLHDEFDHCLSWVKANLTFDVDAQVSHFEATIRLLGGLLSAYELTEERHPILLTKARDLADRLLHAYNTASGLPLQLVNLKTGRAENEAWVGQRVSLAEFGSVQLEFKALAYHTNVAMYRERVERAMEIVAEAMPKQRLPGLLPIFYDLTSRSFVGDTITLGGRGDSFYEMLLKQWLQSNKTDERFRTLFQQAASSIQRHLLFRSKPSGWGYLAQLKQGLLAHEMDHLACFAGGMFALAAAEWPSPQEAWAGIGADIGRCCRAMYDMTPTKLGPEIVDFVAGRDMASHWSKYILRPED